jgi:hypothetical protein
VLKSDHDPVKVLITILGEVPEQQPESEQEGKADVRGTRVVRADAGGRTLEAWLEELEKDKLSRLSKDIERRKSSRV